MKKEYYETADIEVISFSADEVLLNDSMENDPDSLLFQDADQ